MEPNQEMELIELAASLLKAVWSQIDNEYKSKYRMDIWSQFENNVAACARMSSSLHKFLSLLCGKFEVAVPGKDATEQEFVAQVLQGRYGSPSDVLQVLREYPQVCVLFLRNINMQEKEAK